MFYDAQAGTDSALSLEFDYTADTHDWHTRQPSAVVSVDLHSAGGPNAPHHFVCSPFLAPELRHVDFLND